MNHIYFVLQRELPRLQFDVACPLFLEFVGVEHFIECQIGIAIAMMAKESAFCVQSRNDAHTAIIPTRFVNRYPDGAGCERTERPKMAVLVQGQLATRIAGLKEQMATPQDDIRTDKLFDGVKQRRTKGVVEEGPVTAPILHLIVDYMNRYQRIWLLMRIAVAHIAGSILKLRQARHRYAEVGDHITVSAIGGGLICRWHSSVICQCGRTHPWSHFHPDLSWW